MWVSNGSDTHPHIVWSKREFAVLNLEHDFARSIKSLLTTLMNSVMALDSEGRTALATEYDHLTLGTIQVSISAPWAYTISKVIEYERDEPFLITENIIDALTKKAAEKTMEAQRESESGDNAGLSIMTRATMDITANGYHTMTPIGQTAEAVTLTQVTAIAQTLITSAVNDLKVRLFPRAEVERYSTMLVFHCIVCDLYPTMTEYCLVDLTYEATEIAIVRDGVVHYSTHTHIGINTLVRNLAIRLNTPEADAATLLKNIYDTDTLEGLSAKEKVIVEDLFVEYRSALESLFHETGDSLSIPKVIFLHGSYNHEQFFDEQISTAAKAATNSSHTVHTISHDILLNLYNNEAKQVLLDTGIDTSVLMGAQFFHKQQHIKDFTQV